jgi:TRAP-type mannitol/chloroaromatic compound transport system permease small subunit
VRVDLIFHLLSDRKKALMDIISSLIFFFPLMIVLTWVSTKWAVRAWRINEIMISTYWYPPAAPFRTIFAVGALLLLLQGIAKFIRDLYFVIRGEAFD